MSGAAADGDAIMVIRAIYDGVARGDWTGVEARLDPNIVVLQSPDLPFAGEWSGLAGFKALGARIFECWPDFQVKPLAFFGHGETVLVTTRLSGRHRPTAEALDQDMIELWTVRSGRAVRCQPFYFAPSAAMRSTADSEPTHMSGESAASAPLSLGTP